MAKKTPSIPYFTNDPDSMYQALTAMRDVINGLGLTGKAGWSEVLSGQQITGKLTVGQLALLDKPSVYKEGTLYNGSDSGVILAREEANNSEELFFDLDKRFGIFELDIRTLVPATDGAWYLLYVSTDGGATYESTSYHTVHRYHTSAGASLIQYGTAETSMRFAPSAGGGWNPGNGAGESMDAKLVLYRPADTTVWMKILWHSVFDGTGAAHIRGYGSGSWRGGTSFINRVRIKANTGNLSKGVITLRGYGEL